MNEIRISRRRLMQQLTMIMTGTVLVGPASIAQTAAVSPSTAGDLKPVFIPPGGGKKGKIGDGDIVFKLDKSQTSGNLGSAEEVLPPGLLGAPPHYHRNFDEVCIVQEGSLHIMVGDEVTEVPAGGWHLRPRGLVHTFWNSGKTPAKFIELYLPGGHEAYMQELATLFEGGKRPEPGALAKLAQKHDIVFAFDKLKGVMDTYGVHL